MSAFLKKRQILFRISFQSLLIENFGALEKVFKNILTNFESTEILLRVMNSLTLYSFEFL